MKQLDASRDGYEAVQAGAQKATVTVQEALDRLEAAVRLIEAAEQKARLAAEAGTATAVHPVPNPGSGASALASGQEPLDSPGHAPSPGEKAVTRDPSVTGESGGLLGRLESGYTVVSSLLQDLQSRITNLGAVTLSGPESSSLPGAAGTLSGRVTLHISPVRDLDRLLALDNALGLMKGVANVTLADYVRDEAVFRLELHEAISAFDLAREFGRCAGISAKLVQASEGSVSLRIA